MRLLMQVKMPHCKFNEFVKDGTVGQKIQKILDQIKPEAVYFTEYDGHRGAILIVNVEDPSKIPGLSEPWFLAFDADVHFHIVMSPEELGRSGLSTLAKKWC
jgi:hypothetical protein